MNINKLLNGVKNISQVYEGVKPCCADCGCSLMFKTRALASSCPKGKWKELMSEEDEKLLFDQLLENEKKADEDGNNI